METIREISNGFQNKKPRNWVNTAIDSRASYFEGSENLNLALTRNNFFFNVVLSSDFRMAFKQVNLRNCSNLGSML